jgi:ABC-type glycerol-3-phosphate transport system substrate-binding protein
MAYRTTGRPRGLATRFRILTALALAGVFMLAACSSSSSSSSSGAKSSTLQLWLGGVLTTSTPGSAYRAWVNNVIDRFQSQYPGTKVNVTLLPANNDQLAAKVESAFASHSVPDVMMLYSGAYTTVYQQGLMHLNSLINSTPGFYKSFSGWNLSCEHLNCNSGSGTILGVPTDLDGFFLFYNKKLFAKAGLSKPPASWSQLLADCATLKSKGILPMSYGDAEGYTTVNFLDENLASYITQPQMNAILAGHLKLTDPPVVSALDRVSQLRTAGCAQSNASTVDQLNATPQFAAGKSAMVEMYPGLIPAFEKGIGASNLGVAVIPGTGPLGTHVASNSGDNWVIPAQSSNPKAAWNFIKVATDATSAKLWLTDVGLPTTNIAASGNITDPVMRFVATDLNKAGNLELLDSVLPNGVALYLYKDLNLFFAGHMSAQSVMSATQTQLSSSQSAG